MSLEFVTRRLYTAGVSVESLTAEPQLDTAAAELPAPGSPRAGGFAKLAWGLLAYLLVVILFGSWVRISGSGAGCGDHWPTCHGELIPRAPAVQTIIEYTHRVTSGVLGPVAIGMVLWAWLGAGRRRVVGWFATATLVFIVAEALIGAGLVLKQLVADDDSVARAVVVGLHLDNTLLLTAVSALTAWFGAGRTWPGLGRPFAGRGLVLVGLVGVLLVSMTGAVTALGDTLFPVAPTVDGGLFGRLRDDLSAGSHFLVRLRIVHPLLAVLVAAVLLLASRKVSDLDATGPVASLARKLELLVWLQLAAGGVNIALAAPWWMQLLHLLLAQLVWIVLVLLFFAGSERSRSNAGSSSGNPVDCRDTL